MRSNNNKVKDNVFVFKNNTSCLDEFCYKAAAECSQVHKISKQGHVTHMSILMSLSRFLLKLHCFCLFFVRLSILNFDFNIYFYILVLY